MRRSRYEVTYIPRSGGPPTTVLIRAYTEDDAMSYIGRHYGQVLDWRFIPPRRRATPPAAGWELDRRLTQEIIETFELKLPVHFSFTRGLRTGGTHCVKRLSQLSTSARGRLLNRGGEQRLYHHITLSRAWSAEDAGRAVWHELAHAMQDERIIRICGESEPVLVISAIQRHVRTQRSWSYGMRPIEVEARTWEDHADEINPCR